MVSGLLSCCAQAFPVSDPAEPQAPVAQLDRAGGFYPSGCRFDSGRGCNETAAVPGTKPSSLADRLWSRVDKSGGPDACWPWMGRRDRGGYGHIQCGSRRGGVKRGPRQTHRVAYELTFGPIPEGQVVRHKKCDNPPCCNPAHLRLGTQADNIADMVAAGRQSFGARNPNAKLTDADVIAIRSGQSSETTAELAQRFGVSQSLISQIRGGSLWKHVAPSPSALLAGRDGGGA